MKPVSDTSTAHPTLILWLIVGWAGFFLLPWYGVEDGIFTSGWLFDGYPFDDDVAPGFFHGISGKKAWLLPHLIFLIGPIFALSKSRSDPLHNKILIICGALGFGWLIAQGFSIGIRDFTWTHHGGLFVNGAHVKIRGMCDHNDFTGVGMAVRERFAFVVAMCRVF